MEEKENAIFLPNEDGTESEYALEVVLEVDGNKYCVLYPADEEESEEALVFRLVEDENGESYIEDIENDEEFEKVLEAYDEWADEAYEDDEDDYVDSDEDEE